MILLDMKNTPLEATMAGLRLRGSESAATVRRPPFFGWSWAKAIAGSAVEASSRLVPLRTPRREILNSCIVFIVVSMRRAVSRFLLNGGEPPSSLQQIMGGLPENAREGISRQSQRQEILDHSQTCGRHETKRHCADRRVKDCGGTAAVAQVDI